MKEFMAKAKKAYISCGKVLLEKMPLTNPALMCFSSLDPVLRGNSTALQRMKKLPQLFKHLLTDDTPDSDSSGAHCDVTDKPGASEDQDIVEEKFDLERRKFHSDRSLPALMSGVSVDCWWAAVDSDTYPVLTKLVKAALSCFHGPLVESSFSVMADVIDKGNTGIDIATFSAIQTVKYSLSTRGTTAVDWFCKKDPLTESVDKKLTLNMSSAWWKNEERKTKNRAQRERQNAQLGASGKVPTKRKGKEDLDAEAKKARLQHQEAVSLSEMEPDQTPNGRLQVQSDSQAASQRVQAQPGPSDSIDITCSKVGLGNTAQSKPTTKKTKQSSLSCFFTAK